MSKATVTVIDFPPFKTLPFQNILLEEKIFMQKIYFKLLFKVAVPETCLVGKPSFGDHLRKIGAWALEIRAGLQNWNSKRSFCKVYKRRWINTGTVLRACPLLTPICNSWSIISLSQHSLHITNLASPSPASYVWKEQCQRQNQQWVL